MMSRTRPLSETGILARSCAIDGPRFDGPLSDQHADLSACAKKPEHSKEMTERSAIETCGRGRSYALHEL